MRTDTSSAVACSVLVCDDRPELRAAIRLALTGNPRFIVIGEADDAVSCLDRLRETRPDRRPVANFLVGAPVRLCGQTRPVMDMVGDCAERCTRDGCAGVCH